jgi:predicted acyltransferase
MAWAAALRRLIWLNACRCFSFLTIRKLTIAAKLQALPSMSHVELPLALQTRRIVSVDALRGFAMFWIIGGDGAVRSLELMSRHKGPVLRAIDDFLGLQFEHVEWEGLRFYDFIFPLFIFVTGISIALSLPSLVEREGRSGAHLRVIRRALVLFGLGVVVYGGASNYWPDIRLLGVLQRIALCYLSASLLFLNVDWRGLAGTFVMLMVGYWALMTFVPVPGIGAGSFAMDANLANWLDAHYLPGRLFDETRDPEGMLSTLPAIGTCLLGVFAGMLLRDVRMSGQQKSLRLVGAGIVLVAVGHLWGAQFPLIKAIWTSSFVLVTGGYSAILLGAAHQIIDVWKLQRWPVFFVWIGANAIILYCINIVIGFEPFALRFVGGDIARFLDSTVTSGAGRFVAHAVGIAFAIVLAGFLYRRKIFLRA